MAEIAKKTTSRKKGAGRKPLTEAQKANRKKDRELKRAMDIFKKYGKDLASKDIQNDVIIEQQQVQQTTKPQIQQVTKTQTKRKLPADYYNYRYIMNSCRAGAIHLGDIGVFVEVDEFFRKVIRFTEDDFAKSRELGTHLAKGNLIEVTNEYIQFLENGNSPNDWTLWFRPSKVKMETPNFHPHYPKIREDMYMQNDSPIVDENDFSRVHGTSDQYAHMQAAHQNFREGADIHNIEAVLDSIDKNNNPIADENVFDRSNPTTFVDPRMVSAKKMPKSPSVHRMRDGQLALTNEREIYPYTVDHHERAMIAQNADTPYVHIPKKSNPDMPIYNAVPQHMYQQSPQSGVPDRIQTISQQEAQALFQQRMSQNPPMGQQQPSSHGPQVVPGVNDLLNR